MLIGDLRKDQVVRYWWDSGAFGNVIAYALVLSVGKRYVTLLLESGRVQRTSKIHLLDPTGVEEANEALVTLRRRQEAR